MNSDWVHIGALNIIDTVRFATGEISIAQAAAIARSNREGERVAFAAQMAEARKARQRTREWLGL